MANSLHITITDHKAHSVVAIYIVKHDFRNMIHRNKIC